MKERSFGKKHSGLWAWFGKGSGLEAGGEPCGSGAELSKSPALGLAGGRARILD